MSDHGERYYVKTDHFGPIMWARLHVRSLADLPGSQVDFVRDRSMATPLQSSDWAHLVVNMLTESVSCTVEVVWP